MPSTLNQISDADVEEFADQLEYQANTNDLYIGNSLDHYQRLATKTAIYPGCSGPLGLMYVALKLNGEAGELAEHVGKAFRDDGLIDNIYTKEFDDRTFFEAKDLKPERKEALIKEVGDVLWYLSAACNELGISLSDAALTNLKKLNDRTKRNKLSGSGDNR